MNTASHYTTLSLQNLDLAGYGLAVKMAMAFIHNARCNNICVAVSFPDYREGMVKDKKKTQPTLGEKWVLHGPKEELEKLSLLLNGTMESRFLKLSGRIAKANSAAQYFTYSRVRHPDGARLTPYAIISSGSTKQEYSLVIARKEADSSAAEMGLSNETVTVHGLCKAGLALPHVSIE